MAPLRDDQEQGAGVASDSCYTEASASSHMKSRCSLRPKNDSNRCRLGSGLMRVPPLGALLEHAKLPSCVYMPTGVPLPMRGPTGPARLPSPEPTTLRPDSAQDKSSKFSLCRQRKQNTIPTSEGVREFIHIEASVGVAVGVSAIGFGYRLMTFLVFRMVEASGINLMVHSKGLPDSQKDIGSGAEVSAKVV